MKIVALLLCGSLFVIESQAQGTGFYFTTEKNFKYTDVKIYKKVNAGDTAAWGLMYLEGESLKLSEIAENDGKVYMSMECGEAAVSWAVPLASGSKKVSKASRLMSQATETAVSEGFYFKVFPNNGNQINKQWSAFFGNLILLKEQGNAEAEVSIKVGLLREPYHFSIILKNGLGIFETWGRPYADQKIALAKAEADEAARAQKTKDSLEGQRYWQKHLDYGDNIRWYPTILEDKTLTTQIEKAVRNAMSNDYEVFRVYCVDADWSYSKNDFGVVLFRYINTYVPYKVKKDGKCRIIQGYIYQDYIADGKFATQIRTHLTPDNEMRCETLQQRLVDFPK